MITKKDFNAIAEIIKNNSSWTDTEEINNNFIPLNEINGKIPFISELIEYFKSVNPLFDEEKFLTACLK